MGHWGDVADQLLQTALPGKPSFLLFAHQRAVAPAETGVTAEQGCVEAANGKHLAEAWGEHAKGLA